MSLPQPGSGAEAPWPVLDMTERRVLGVLVEKASFAAAGPLAKLPYRIDVAGFSSHGSWRAAGSVSSRNALMWASSSPRRLE